MDMCVYVHLHTHTHTPAYIYKQVCFYGKTANVLNISIKYFYPKLIWQKTCLNKTIFN